VTTSVAVAVDVGSGMGAVPFVASWVGYCDRSARAWSGVMPRR
jgi:hypothetical protein